jgi:transposase
MGQNFVGADRDQVFLLPPSLRDWLPEDHLAWWVIDAVADMDLSGFYARYRVDGHGRPAYDPAVLVAVLLYAYAIGERSGRRIERRCVEDIAFRVLAGNLTPDHVTICRFRQQHQDGLAGLFGQVLALCAKAGMLSVGTVAGGWHPGRGERFARRDCGLRTARADDLGGGRGGRRGRG